MKLETVHKAMIKRAGINELPYTDSHFSEAVIKGEPFVDKEHVSEENKVKALLEGHKELFNSMTKEPGIQGWSIAEGSAGSPEVIGVSEVYPFRKKRWYSYNDWVEKVAKALKKKRLQEAKDLMALDKVRTLTKD